MSLGASPEDRKAFQEICKDPANKACFDCGGANPQWANIHHGILMCLDCAGIHRGLGVHLSFVRSISMDKWLEWKPEKLKQMQIGGNAKAAAFFAAKGVPAGNKGCPADQQAIKARYNHIGAFMYRAKLEAEAQGRTWSEQGWTPPHEYNPNWDKPVQRGSGRGGYAGRGGGGLKGLGAAKRDEGSTLDDAGKVLGQGLSALGSMAWAAGSAVGSAGSAAASGAAKGLDVTAKAASGAARNATEGVDLGRLRQGTSEGASAALSATASAASAGWGWFSKGLAKAGEATGLGNADDDDGFGALRRNLAGGDTAPKKSAGGFTEGEQVMYTPSIGDKTPIRVTIAAIDDRTDPPSFILRLADGGKRGGAHHQLSKISTGSAFSVGDVVVWQVSESQAPQRAEVAAVDDRSDPPTYIVKLDDGGKRGAQQSQLRRWGERKFESQAHAPSPTPSPASPAPAAGGGGAGDGWDDDWGDDTAPAAPARPPVSAVSRTTSRGSVGNGRRKDD